MEIRSPASAPQLSPRWSFRGLGSLPRPVCRLPSCASAALIKAGRREEDTRGPCREIRPWNNKGRGTCSITNWRAAGPIPSFVFPGFPPLPSGGPPMSFVFLQTFPNYPQLPPFARTPAGRRAPHKSMPRATILVIPTRC